MERRRESLLEEAERILDRPQSTPPRFLSCVEIVPAGDQNSYCRRLRRVIHSAVALSCVQDFEEEILDGSGIPVWFAQLTSGDLLAGRVVADDLRDGVSRYFEARGGEVWDLQEWLFMFDPGLRSWSWWDVAGFGDGKVFLYFDANGEAVIPCEELWWAIFASGAKMVEGPFLVPSGRWEGKPSMGTVLAE